MKWFWLTLPNSAKNTPKTKTKKQRLRESDIDLILETFQNKTQKADFCALVSFDEIIEKIIL